MKTVALLLDESKNQYQQLLLRRAREQAGPLRFELFDSQYADGSSWNQLESINNYLRLSTPPDALLVMLAGEQHNGSWLERVIAKNIAVVFLNRIPPWLTPMRRKFPHALLAAVAPTQLAVGRLQAEQAMRLVRSGSFVILITGATKSPTAVERQRGFMDTVKRHLNVCVLDGRWSAQDAEAALTEWFQLGAERARPLSLIACQNDPMAQGAHRALLRYAKSSGRPEIARVPLLGCDGLEAEGQAWVRSGILTATIILSPTTPIAFEILQRYWASGVRCQTIELEVTSFPPLQNLRSI